MSSAIFAAPAAAAAKAKAPVVKAASAGSNECPAGYGPPPGPGVLSKIRFATISDYMGTRIKWSGPNQVQQGGKAVGNDPISCGGSDTCGTVTPELTMAKRYCFKLAGNNTLPTITLTVTSAGGPHGNITTAGTYTANLSKVTGGNILIVLDSSSKLPKYSGCIVASGSGTGRNPRVCPGMG